MRKCCVEGCDKNVRSTNAQWCEMHYARMRRNGTLDKRPDPAPTLTSGGYLKAKGEYVHRTVFFRENGRGEHACKWCGTRVSGTDLHVDHVDECKTNNSPENLVASCFMCNIKRSRHIRDKIHYRQSKKITHNGVTRSLREWAKIVGITYGAMLDRTQTGWTDEQCVTVPPERSKSVSAKKKMSDADVREAIELMKKGWTGPQLSKRYGVNRSVFFRIRSGTYRRLAYTV